MESLQVAVDWILGIVITLFVPALVWVAVIVGVISIVQDKVHREDSTFPSSGHASVCGRVCSGHRSDRFGAQAAAKERSRAGLTRYPGFCGLT